MFFPKAVGKQKKRIIEYIEVEIAAARAVSLGAAGFQVNKEPLTTFDVERLFECYDEKGEDYIKLLSVRDRIDGMKFTSQSIATAVKSNFYGDDYVGIDEFVKLFRPYITDSRADHGHREKSD
jgi:hypothetical protein